jgi:N-methylhydantoinase A
LSEDKQIRIGIDVGGTFTHAVAVDHKTYSVLAHSVVPTTHRDSEGVAKGIVESLNQLLMENNISPSQVVFIAHSTTQATNALLEGDVVKVGILASGSGLEGMKVRGDTRIGDLTLAPGRTMKTFHRYFESKMEMNENAIVEILKDLIEQGCEAVVAATAFSVDNPSEEIVISKLAQKIGVPATGTHEISKLYGLRVRTRTAVINASILPKMIESAEMTEISVRNAGIGAQLMIMRGDGGVMDSREVKRRPILTMLSGPAAGVAGALIFGHISDGVFLEVGGTSTDISAIKNGRVMVKYAEVGGHKTYLHSLDTRTVGVAGGSMIRLSNGKVVGVGPRSAHIAGFPYVSFTDPSVLQGAKLIKIQPLPDDPEDYIILETPNGQRFALTTTCAANLTHDIEPDDYAYGNANSCEFAFTLLGKELGVSAVEAATQVLQVAVTNVTKVIRSLIEEYHLDNRSISLVGGGGGAGAIVHFTARMLGLPHTKVPKSEVISAVGVALAMVRETIERNLINPTQDDILRLRKEAELSAFRLGATPESIEVFVEVDATRQIVRATAIGATELRERQSVWNEVTMQKRIENAAESMGIDPKNVALSASTSDLDIFTGVHIEKRVFGLMKKEIALIRVIDHSGVVRLQASSAFVVPITVEATLTRLEQLIDETIAYEDGGKQMPGIFLLYQSKVLDLSGMNDSLQILAVAEAELNGLPNDEAVVLISTPKK